MRQGRPASSALGALLDRSVVQIEAAAADGRTFDRETVRAVSDVWDNNTFPLFHVALARTRWGGERRARVALAWMAAFGAKRRAWMMEQMRAAGHRPEPLLPAPVEDGGPGRDYRGVVMPRPVALTGEAARSLAADYDLTGGDVRTLRVERAGVDRLVGFLGVEAGRRFSTGSAGVEPAILELWLDKVTEVRFDSADRSPVTLDALPEGIVIGIGADGVVRAKQATVYCDDSYWHLSAAGLTADRTTPPRGAEPARPVPVRRPEHLDGAALVAATVLRGAMWEIRSVRYPRQVGKVPITVFCQAFTGAGTDILAAGGHWSTNRREDAFRGLVERWIGRVDPALHDRFRHWLSRVGDASGIAESTRTWLATLAPETPPHPRSGTAPAGHRPLTQAALRLASYTAAHTRYGSAREASSTLNLALPPGPQEAADKPWRLRSLKIDNARRFHLHTRAFDGPGDLRLAQQQDKVNSISLHGDALTVSAEAC